MRTPHNCTSVLISHFRIMRVYMHCLLPFFLIISRVHSLRNCPSPIPTYTVSSSGLDSPSCTSGDVNTSCKTLGYLIEEKRVCANITILDSLTLSQTLVLDSSQDLVLAGSLETSVITCDSGIGVVFTNSQRVQLQRLQFTGCSVKCPNDSANNYPLVDIAALCVYQTHNVNITDCSFVDGKGTGVILNDVTGTSVFTNTTFARRKIQDRHTNQTSGGLLIKRVRDKSKVTYTIDSCSFTDNANHAIYGCYGENHPRGLGGGLHFHQLQAAESSTSVVYVTGSRFLENFSVQGGGMHVYQSANKSSVYVSIRNSSFESNNVTREGGGLWLTQVKGCLNCVCKLEITESNFTNNSGNWGGGVAMFSGNLDGSVSMAANHSNWTCNSAQAGGYAIATYFEAIGDKVPSIDTTFHMFAQFEGCNFLDNVVNYTDNSIGAVQMGGTNALFSNCAFMRNAETALFVNEFGYATFAGNTTFGGNHGIRGAAIYVGHQSAIGLSKDGASLKFVDNYAVIEGGAIFTEPTSSDLYKPPHNDICVFESLRACLNQSLVNYTVYFKNNTANGEDRSIFVGSSSGCVEGAENFLFDSRIFTFVPHMKGQVSSLPTDNFTLGYYHSNDSTIHVMLGEYFYLSPQVTDIFNNTAYNLFGNLQIVSYNEGENLVTPKGLHLTGPKMIGMDSYTEDNELFLNGSLSYVGNESLYVAFVFNKPSRTYSSQLRRLSIKIVECRIGYKYVSDSGTCECILDDRLSCEAHSSHACIRYGYWLDRYSLTNGSTFPCSGQNCEYADGKCPRNDTCSGSLQDFCRLDSSDDLCWEGRGGIMCSSCKNNYSFTFSAMKCVSSSTCKPINTTLIIFGIFLYWILILVFLFVVLNLNLSTGLGFLYGIVYYFSVLSVFTDKTITDSFLTVVIDTCIAVTQLSPRVFGAIHHCFAASWDLNMHHQMFRYVSPIFVIGAILFIVWVSRYCRCPKVISLAKHSPIHGFCILILFSYTSLTYTSFEILKPIRINGETRVYADPDIEYFGRKHLPYAIVALFFECFVSLPICFLLLFAPYLVGRVNLVRLRLKPILDDLQACYRPGCYWFAGFYFLARQLLYLANTIPYNSLPQESIILHFANAAILVVHSSYQPYKLKWLNTLDTLLLIDMFFLSFFNLGWSSSVFHRAIPYVFILPPALYLLLVTFLMTFRRLFKCCMSMKSFRRRFRRYRERIRPSYRPTNTITDFTSAAPSGATCTTVGFEDARSAPEETRRDPTGANFFEDYGDREPLLADDVSEGSDEEERRNVTSSSRGSTLSRFPPRVSARKNATD